MTAEVHSAHIKMSSRIDFTRTFSAYYNLKLNFLSRVCAYGKDERLAM